MSPTVSWPLLFLIRSLFFLYLLGIPLYMTSHFCLAAFTVFTVPLAFIILILMCLESEISRINSTWNSLCFMGVHKFFINFLSHYFFKYIFLLFFLFFCTSITHMFMCLIIFLKSFMLCTFAFYFLNFEVIQFYICLYFSNYFSNYFSV